MEKKRRNAPLTTLEYRRLERYDILAIGDVDKLLEKRRSDEEQIRSPYEAMFGVPLRNRLADLSLPLQATPNLCHEEDLEILVNSQDQPEPELSSNSDEDEVDPINN
ncbi:hypothetical protein QE152_g15353 [Popillia japonica]|uniref:Uncharacterized protein n=1 Tax=Popillia japonica TaxID=7064 RepID=A0AAW1L841_POPJA